MRRLPRNDSLGRREVERGRGKRRSPPSVSKRDRILPFLPRSGGEGPGERGPVGRQFDVRHRSTIRTYGFPSPRGTSGSGRGRGPSPSASPMFVAEPRSRPHPNLPQQFWGRWASNAEPGGGARGVALKPITHPPGNPRQPVRPAESSPNPNDPSPSPDRGAGRPRARSAAARAVHPALAGVGAIRTRSTSTSTIPPSWRRGRTTWCRGWRAFSPWSPPAWGARPKRRVTVVVDNPAGEANGSASVACAARCRQPRSDPRAGRAREQPQGRQRRDPEAPADGVHRRLRLGQELAGVRHDRRGVAAADQRDLQRLRAGLHADAGAARGRRARRPDDGDHRRPGADGRQPPLHRRHRHRRQRDAAHPLQPAREAAHRLAQRVLVQRPLGEGQRCDHHRARRRQDEDREGDLHPSRRHVSALRGHGLGHRLRPVCAVRRQLVAQRGRAHDPRLQHGRLVRPHLPRLRLLRPGQADPQVHQEGTARPALQGADQDQGRRDQPDVRGADPDRSRSRSCPRTSTRCSRTSAPSWSGR